METINAIYQRVSRKNKLKGFSDLLNYAMMPEKNYRTGYQNAA